LEFARDMQQQARQIGANRALAMCTLFLGTAEYFQGRFHQALANLQKARELYAELHAFAGEAISLQRMGVVGTALGRLDEAHEYLREGLRVSERAMMKAHCLVRLYATLGRNRLEAGDYPAVREAVEAGLAVEAKHGLCVTCNVMLYPISTMGFAASGDMERARFYAAKAEQSAKVYGSPFFFGLTYQAQGMLHGLLGEWAVAFEKLQQAKKEFQTIRQDYEIARSDLFRAFVLMRRGAPKDYLAASRLVGGALPIFTKLGAETMVAQARSALKQWRTL
jgi:tetratricopeptide (TPR) repeat protein